MIAVGEWMEKVPERGQHMQRPSGGRMGAVWVTEGCLCDSILGKGFVGAGDWELLRKKGLAEVKSRKTEN